MHNTHIISYAHPDLPNKTPAHPHPGLHHAFVPLHALGGPYTPNEDYITGWATGPLRKGVVELLILSNRVKDNYCNC